MTCPTCFLSAETSVGFFVTMLILIITVFLIIICHKYEPVCSGCSHAEYETEKQCCPMCASGNRVFWHCTDDTSTTCIPCPEFTFTDEPNGLMKCFPCAACDTGRGLRLSKACTRTSDTVCEPMERFYCVDKNKGSCILAASHTECSPGQYIKQAGSGSTDTVCADCTGDTYSNGSFSSCLPHTKCEAMGLTETNPGTHSSDSECVKSSTSTIIIAIIVAFALILITVVSVFTIKHIWKRKKSKSSGVQESGSTLDGKISPPVVGGRINVQPDTLEEQVGLKNWNNPTETITLSCVNVTSQPEDIPVMTKVQCLQEQTVPETKQKRPQMTLLL